MKGLLKIGEFARLGHVSIKALRHYDAEGLLRPEHIDRQTGYRYYTVDQAPALALITNLRRVGLSIAEISALLDSGAERRLIEESLARRSAALAAERAEIDRQALMLNALANALENDAADNLSAVKLTSIAPQLMHSVVKTVPHLGAPVTAIFESAETAVAAAEARANAAPCLIFHDAPAKPRDLRIEVCIPLTHDPGPGLASQQDKGSDFACSVVYGGDYSSTDGLHKKMLRWIERSRLKPAGPLREVYHRFGADEDGYRLPPSVLARQKCEYLTELQIPVSIPTNTEQSE